MATSATPMPPSHHQQRVRTEVSQGKCHGRDCLCCPPGSHDSLHPIPPHPDAGHRLFIVFLNGCYIRAAAAAVWMFPFAREESKKAYLPISELSGMCHACSVSVLAQACFQLQDLHSEKWFNRPPLLCSQTFALERFKPEI